MSLLGQHHFSMRINGETLAATIDYNADQTAPTILNLHGGGPSGRRRAVRLTQYLAQQGHSVLGFDHSGWGDSTGDRAQASLKTRVAEAIAAMTLHGQPDQPLTVIGTSMGGAVAIELLAHLPIATLILFCPAAYAAAAFDVPFGPDFTTLLRQPNSWQTARTFHGLEHFSGTGLFVTGGQDQTVPHVIAERYAATQFANPLFHHIHLPDAPHTLHEWLADHPDQEDRVFTAILQAIQAG